MSAVSVSSCFSVTPRPRRCCRCNGSAKCLRCACVRNGTPCSHCLPWETGNCHNTLPRVHLTSATPPSPPTPPSIVPPASSCPSSQPSQVPTPSSPPTPGLVLPSLSTALQSSIPTLQHVPKGARDRWAGVLSDCLSSVVEDPADVSCWSTVFMLAKCVLTSPSAGHRLRWREVLRLVMTRIQRWINGNLAALWSEAVAGTQSLCKLSLSTSQHSSNIRRAKLAVQDGQFSKAIKALSSDGLAIPSAAVLQDMLAKHPKSTPPSLPPGLVPPPVTVSESAVRKGVRSFSNGSAHGPSGLCPSHLGEAVGCPSPDRANKVLAALTRLVNFLASGRAPSDITPHPACQFSGIWRSSIRHHLSPLWGHTPGQQEGKRRPPSHCFWGGSASASVKVPRHPCALLGPSLLCSWV